MQRASFAILLTLALAHGQRAGAQDAKDLDRRPEPKTAGKPVELRLTKAGSSTVDLRLLPPRAPRRRERPEREDPRHTPIELPGAPVRSAPVAPGRSVPAPAPNASFDGLDFANWGAGHPPDTNGDVGPTYYIQTINSSIGIYRKSDSVRVAAFTFDTFMSQGNFGNLCDTDNFGDPVVLYDTFEDRWVLTDFAFKVDGSGNVVSPPGNFQCFAVSKTGDPVTGGWNYYSINTAGGLGDYPKFGIWPDGLYMTTSMFDYAASGSFQNPRVYALNKAQMYAGAPTVQVVTFDGPPDDFTILPSNARLQTGTPPPGTPNYFVGTWYYLNRLTVYKFHVDWNSIALSTFAGPDVPLAATSWPDAAVANAATPGNSLDVLQIRAMAQNQYSSIGGVESLWVPHTVRRANTSGFAAPRWYQVDVTGGTVAANLPQAATWDPDGANVMNRYMPSLAVDRQGNLALGYTTSNSTTNPALKYAGRLATDPLNTFSYTEQLLFQGTGTQTGNCGRTCSRWGDYSAMTLDPDGCTFWYTNEYYAVDGLDHRTRIGSFSYPECTPLGTGGTLTGTVFSSGGGPPIAGATVDFGSRVTITDGSGAYTFSGLRAGTYPSMSASAPGYGTGSATTIVIGDGATTTRNFLLATSPTSACLTDTTQAHFQSGVTSNVDLATAPGAVTLAKLDVIDQQNTTVTNNGFGFNSTAWAGQTFLAAASGRVMRVDVDLFCSGCTGTTPNLTVAIRATTGSPALPTGPDLATATIAGFSGGGGLLPATFATPATINAGTTYAVIVRAVSNPSAGTYAYVCSCASPNSNPYTDGQRTTSSDSGGTWTADATAGGRDIGFKIYVNPGYTPAGNLISSQKDSNPAIGLTPTWSTLSWTESLPANTNLRFQAAGSNSAFGPFNFVGPDGTAGTFFDTPGSSLSQFVGRRYLHYKAYEFTTSGAVTPVLSDVTVCFANTPSPDLTLTKSDGDVTVAPGGTASYALTYANVSPAGATGVVLTETVPASSTFNAGASGAGWSCSPGTGAGSVCTLAIGAVAGSSGNQTVTFAVSVDNPATVTMVNNTASIADDGTHGTDLTPGNNTASDSTPVGKLDFYTLAPCRLLDTRTATGPYGSPPLLANTTRAFVGINRCGVPADARALSINITVTNPTAPGDLRSYATGLPAVPLVSVINYAAGSTRANNTVVGLGAAGDFVLQCDQGAGTVDAIVDVNGYFRQ